MAGIPNITGKIGKIWDGIWTLPTNRGYEGCISVGPVVPGQGVPLTQSTGPASASYCDIIDASKSHNVYRNDADTVVPLSRTCKFIISY